MLCLARGLRPEPATGESVRRHQGPVDDDGAGTEKRLIAGFCRPADFAQNKFLQEAVEVYLEQAQVTARPDRGAIMIRQLAFAEIVFGGDDETGLIERA